MMKVLHINVTYQYGSTGKIVQSIHQALLKHQHESLVAYGRHFKDEQNHLYAIGHKMNVILHGVKSRLLDRHGFGSNMSTVRFIKDIDFKSFDVIHLHNIHGYYLNIKHLFKALKKADIPIIWTLHDSWSYTGHCAYYIHAMCDRWKTGCHHCPELKQYPSSVWMDQSKRNYREKKAIFTSVPNITFVTPSLWLKNELKASYLSDYPVRHIFNGIDLSKFKPLVPRQKNERFMILGVASIWERRKGLSVFNWLADTLGDDYSIVIVGQIPKHVHISERITHIHRTENVNDLARLYSQADCFINPTLEDNLPTTSIEALACGTPVITYHAGGAKEIIDDTCGYVVDKDRPESMMDAIKTIQLHGKSFYEDHAVKRSKVFDQTIMTDGYLSLYKEIIR